ncbi:unnamed protein product [Peniophora sp. CBMAI 1063]|nr:unnamed protein product [Peniophora sp. CBMAI 1063]
MTPTPHRVYSQELSSAFRRGYPIANPQAAVYHKAGNSSGDVGVRRAVEIGDVGYIQPGHGYFIRLFNVHLEPGVDGQPPRDRLPDDFEVLPKDEMTTVTDNTPLFLSRTMTTKSVRAAASGPFFGGSAVFSSTSSRGAILATPDPIECTDASCIPIYMRYARAHMQSWYDFFSQRYLLEMEDLMLVTGVDRTTSWATAVIADTELEAGFGLDVQFADTASGIQLACQYSWKSTFGAFVNSGPRRGGSSSGPEISTSGATLSDDPIADCRGDMSHIVGKQQPINFQNDQTLFVRHIRAKRRPRWMGMKLAAAGGTREEDEHGDDSEFEDGLVTSEADRDMMDLETFPERETFTDCLDPVLDYIFEHSDSDIAIAHDDDLTVLLDNDSSFGLGVEVEDGIGAISSGPSASRSGTLIGSQSFPSRGKHTDLPESRDSLGADVAALNRAVSSESHALKPSHDRTDLSTAPMPLSAIRELFDRPPKAGGRPLPQPPDSLQRPSLIASLNLSQPTLPSSLSTVNEQSLPHFMDEPGRSTVSDTPRIVLWHGIPLLLTPSTLPYPRHLPSPSNARSRSHLSPGPRRRLREANVGGTRPRPSGARFRATT